MSRRAILTLAALTIAPLGAVGCGGSESDAKIEANADPAATIGLRAPFRAAGDADGALLRFGVPKGWKGIEGDDERLPVAAIEKSQGASDCRLFLQIVAGPKGSEGLLQPGESKLLRKSGADSRSLKVTSSGAPRSGTFSFHIYDSNGELSPTGPAAVSIGELQIAGDPAIPPLVIIARGGLDGCSAKAPRDAVTETRAALRVLIEQMSVKV